MVEFFLEKNMEISRQHQMLQSAITVLINDNCQGKILIQAKLLELQCRVD